MPQWISQITAMALKDNMLDLDAYLMFKRYIYKDSNYKATTFTPVTSPSMLLASGSTNLLQRSTGSAVLSSHT